MGVVDGREAAGLAEAIDPERDETRPQAGAEEGQRVGGTIDHGDDRVPAKIGRYETLEVGLPARRLEVLQMGEPPRAPVAIEPIR